MARVRYVKKCDKTQLYVGQTRQKEDALAVINASHYVHPTDHNIMAILHTVNSDSALKELKGLGLMQVYSTKKQVLTDTNEILSKMKSIDTSEDFSVRDFSEIENGGKLKPFMYLKSFKQKYRPKSSNDLVIQKYQFVSEEDQDVTYFLCKIVETTDMELKQFVGKALVQRVENKHMIFTKPQDIISTMKLWLPMITYKRSQLMKR